MLFYNKNGKLIHIKKLDFPNDREYYETVMKQKIGSAEKRVELKTYPVVQHLLQKLDQ